jgi:endoglucanase
LETLPLLKALSEAPGPAGREQNVCQVINTHWTSLVDEIRVDAMGNLIALKHGHGPAPRPALMIAAHMDEIGLIVTGIEREFLRIHSLGGIDRRVLLGLEVTVHGQRDLPGIIGTRPPHVLPREERRKVIEWHQVFVDVGLSPKEVKSLVRVGDHITIHRDVAELKNGLVAGKAMDNRASVAAVTLALAELQNRNHAWDVYAVATVQEEVGLKGAITSAYGINPDVALAIDVTFGKQHVGAALLAGCDGNAVRWCRVDELPGDETAGNRDEDGRTKGF